ncbi:MAG: AsmA-like C-terminal region-containing protein [Candidatus Omnitrophica bacterium]|nr:AsmA-like C-terminal region-containing protein [Candidatus Omnitrophota bacterium]
MENYSRPYFTKPLLIFIAVAVAVIVSISFGVNIFLSVSKDAIASNLTQFLDTKVSVGKISYSAFNSITLRDVCLFESRLSEEPSICFGKIKSSFSLWQILTKKSLSINDIGFYDSTIQNEKMQSFLRVNGADLINLIYSLPKKDSFALYLKNLFVVFASEIGDTARISIDGEMKVEKKQISGFVLFVPGRLSFDDGTVRVDIPLTCRFTGDVKGGRVSIDNLEFKRNNTYTKLWGALEDNALRMNGFSYTSDVELLRVPAQFVFNLKDNLKTLYKQHSSAKIINRTKANFDIFDIDCLMKFNFPKVQIKKLEFSVNNIPILIKGDLTFEDSLVANLFLSSFPRQSPVLRNDNPNRFDGSLFANLRRDGFSGGVHIDLARQMAVAVSTDQLTATFKGFAFKTAQNGNTITFFKEVDLSYLTKNNKYDFLFSEFNALFNFDNEVFKAVSIASKLYDGSFDAIGRLDTRHKPLSINFDMSINGITAVKLSSLSSHFSKVEGKVYGKINYHTYPESTLSGKLHSDNGILNDFRFFQWLANSFDIPTLRRIRFDKLGIGFLINNEEMSLKNITLRSKDVGLRGYYTVRSNDLISSKLSLFLSKELLSTSPKFRPLIKILSREAFFPDFDFQLSGVSSALNFKWLDSKFKQQLRDRVPNFVERGIERKIEAIINPD